MDHRLGRPADLRGRAADAEQLRPHQSLLDDPRPEGLPGGAAIRRRRHGRHARLNRRGDDLSLRGNAVGPVRRRPRVPPPDRRRRLRSGPAQLDVPRVPVGLVAAGGAAAGGTGSRMNPGLRCGRIRYTNDLPIYAAFDAGAIEYPGTLHADVPSRLNAMLLSGELDLSPVSAFAWAANADELVLLPDLCIGARDEVVSVVLVSKMPPAQLDGIPIYVTGESASGKNLLRVLLERRYGVHAEYV